MPFVGDMPYMMGCTCPDCLEIKNNLEQFSGGLKKLSAEMTQAYQTFKSWAEVAQPSLYSTYNQYQVVPYSEFYQELIAGPSYIEPKKPSLPSQEEINTKWRPWFDALTLTQRKILEKNFPSTLPVSGEFPEKMSETWWLAVKSHLDNPYNHVMYMISQIPVFNTEVTLPCGGSCELPCTKVSLYSIIMHMNDIHNWSFNDIANWLDTLGLDLSFPIPEEITEH